MSYISVVALSSDSLGQRVVIAEELPVPQDIFPENPIAPVVVHEITESADIGSFLLKYHLVDYRQ